MELKEANTAFEEARIITDLQVLKGIKVVGMTTSGAARLRKLLQALAPRIGNFYITITVRILRLHSCSNVISLVFICFVFRN